MRILINAGVPVDHVNDLGWTAMLETIVLNDGSADQVDVVRQLIGAGADTGIRDENGRTPRSLPAAAGFDRIVAVIDDADEIRARGQRLISAARAGDEDRGTKRSSACCWTPTSTSPTSTGSATPRCMRR